MIKTNNRLQPFQRDELFLSLYESLKHRKTALTDAIGLTDTIINMLCTQINNAVLDKPTIINATTQTLHKFDKIAVTHYTAFHPTNNK